VVAGWLGVLLLVAFGASCGHQYFLTGTKVTPTPTSTSSASPTATPTAGLVFATNYADGTLSEFSRDLVSGALTLIGTTGVGAASGPTGLTLSPSNGFLYVANAADHLVREFSVDTASGTLTAIGSVGDGLLSSPQRIAIDSTDSFLYVTNGAFTLGGVVVQPIGIAAAPDGGAMYAADFGSGRVMALKIQAGGALALVNSVPSLGPNGPGQPRSVVVDPTGNFVYVTDAAGGVVSVFAVSAGNALTFVAGYSTAALVHDTYDLTLADNAAALYLYATNGTIDTVADFVVSGGVLSLAGSTGGFGGPQGIVSAPDGNFVYVANSATGQIFGYMIGAAGALGFVGAFDTEEPPNPASAPAFLAITQ
jgi:DNA-binding beta-propeller fold protein YncE